jgi:hypothetical protein
MWLSSLPDRTLVFSYLSQANVDVSAGTSDEGHWRGYGESPSLRSGRPSLRIEAYRGFERPILEYFDRVRHREAACGTALESRRSVVVEDVTDSVVFQKDVATLEAMLDARVRSVQSIPLIGESVRR